MNALEIESISKRFDSFYAVKSLSFLIPQGTVYGLLGPNGAGKTTTIRMIMNIIIPDEGNVKVLNKKMDEEMKRRIGYLPEERGLYKKMSVIQSIEYIAALKGMSGPAAQVRADTLLKRVDMLPHQNKKTEELSRGMSQLVQFMITIIHEPELIILDEPFANLDPVNTELLKEIILELKAEGKAIILSTHRMNEVEELCDRIFMINKGQNVLYGDLVEIKSKYRNNSILLEFEGELPHLEGITGKHDYRDHIELFFDRETSPHEILEQLVNQGIHISRFEVSTPSLNDIFLELVGKEQ